MSLSVPTASASSTGSAAIRFVYPPEARVLLLSGTGCNGRSRLAEGGRTVPAKPAELLDPSPGGALEAVNGRGLARGTTMPLGTNLEPEEDASGTELRALLLNALALAELPAELRQPPPLPNGRAIPVDRICTNSSKS